MSVGNKKVNINAKIWTLQIKQMALYKDELKNITLEKKNKITYIISYVLFGQNKNYKRRQHFR